MRRVKKLIVTVLCMIMAVSCLGYFDSIPVSATDRVTVYPRDYDGNYSVTNGTGITYDANGHAKLGTIANGDKAMFPGVDLGSQYSTLKNLTISYSKIHSYNVEVKIRLDSENGPILGSFYLNKQTKANNDYVTQDFSKFNMSNVYGDRDLYLTFYTSYSIPPTLTTALDIDYMTFTNCYPYEEYTPYDTNAPGNSWVKKYYNETNKKKPYYMPDPRWLRPCSILVQHKNEYGKKTLIFASPYGIRQEEANIGKVKGITYSYKNNTLTLNNCKKKDYRIVANNMGSSFKIKLVGKNTIQHIESYGNKWPCGMHFTGTGSLTVNSVKDPASSLLLYSWYGDKLVIDKKTKITAYAAKGKSPVILRFGENPPSIKNSYKIQFDSKKKKLSGKFKAGSKSTYLRDYVYSKTTFKKN